MNWKAAIQAKCECSQIDKVKHDWNVQQMDKPKAFWRPVLWLEVTKAKVFGHSENNYVWRSKLFIEPWKMNQMIENSDLKHCALDLFMYISDWHYMYL